MILLDENERIHIWDEAVVACTAITDRLGKGIDPGIFEAVVALRVLGIHTSGSCEGHEKEGSPSPWIDIEAVVTKEELMPGSLAMQKAQEEEALGRLPKEEIWRLYREARALNQDVSRKHLKEKEKIMRYLATFYAEGNVQYDRHIIIQGLTLQGIAGHSRIESQGAALLPLFSPKQQAQKLVEYQEEMQLFAFFLKKMFFCARLPLSLHRDEGNA